jgi:hypothetical protein
MMHIKYKLLILALIAIVGTVSATNITSSCGLTASGPFNILVSLGLEYILPIDWAYLFYNVIALTLLYATLSLASQRDIRFYAVGLPLLAAALAFFGWYNGYGTSSMQIWGNIIATGLIGTGVYLKETNREKWGAGGGGSTLINFVFFIILLQACVGLINGSQIWQDNTAPTPTQYQNVNLEQQIGGINNSGGLFGGAISTLEMLGVLAIQALIMVLTVIATIAAFSAVLVFVFPFLGSGLPLQILIVTQIVVWLLYLWMWFIFTYKPPAIDQIGIG